MFNSQKHFLSPVDEDGDWRIRFISLFLAFPITHPKHFCSIKTKWSKNIKYENSACYTTHWFRAWMYTESLEKAKACHWGLPPLFFSSFFRCWWLRPNVMSPTTPKPSLQITPRFNRIMAKGTFQSRTLSNSSQLGIKVVWFSSRKRTYRGVCEVPMGTLQHMHWIVLENFQRASDPPRLFFGKNVAIFQKFMTTSTEFATKFFRSEIIHLL